MNIAKVLRSFTEWGSYLDTFPYDNVSETLQKSIAVLKSGEITPETVALMTSSIENVIEREDEIRDAAYSHRRGGFRYHGHPFFYYSRFGRD